ncbi:hypothetical protein ALC62_06651 [Cyphomyrmex costatus]|uniref:DNA-directed DNA polymerase n=1 Tax=Cyphomyrmex costatus TaxID=456900 RepID=A0A151IJ37_9HYME|nr:hypothetical protein ALC62_06651 [Cyphomyrmex costatus]
MQSEVHRYKHIEPRQFLEDASSVVLERVRGAIERHGSVKVNTAFNGEFIEGDKRTVMSINSKNCELYPASNVREWYVSRVIEPTLASLEEHQERDSGWALSRILNLTVNVNKLNPMHAGCYVEVPKVVAALYPAENHVYRASSYPYYSTVLNFADIEFPVKLKDISKFERSNNVSVNVYGIKDGDILPLRLTDDKKERHINLLYVQDGDTGHFVTIKHLSRLVGSQLSKKKNKKFFCDRDEDSRNCVKLRFIDSYKFLSSSLDKLASYLEKDKLKIVRSEFSSLSDEDFNLLTRKGVFPYEYVDCVEKLNDTRLPPRESFHSSLTGDTVSESDYAHAANVWKRFSVRTLGEYSDLYLKTDVLLLTDVFENFRESCVASYGLDPAHYYTLPGFTWDAMLKHTRVKFELLTDIDMVMFIERGIRGGLSQCSGRYAKANNNGWAMCQPLPYADFRWAEDAANFDANAIAPDSPTEYILEVDLECPQHLHDVHADLPFCPMRDKPPGKRENKLLATLYYKQRYVIHYRNLQQCIHHDLRVTKIHRVLRFAQSAWLRDYIELNTQFRTRAKNDFEKNLYKLMNNAVFGKTMENVRDRVDVKLVTTWDGRYGAEALIAKPNFHSRSVFAENLIAVELRKLEMKFDKPIYVGMCILDISKVCCTSFITSTWYLCLRKIVKLCTPTRTVSYIASNATTCTRQ